METSKNDICSPYRFKKGNYALITCAQIIFRVYPTIIKSALNNPNNYH